MRLVSWRLVRLPGLEARRERERLWILMASDDEGFPPPMYVLVTKLFDDEDDRAPTSEAVPEDTASK